MSAAPREYDFSALAAAGECRKLAVAVRAALAEHLADPEVLGDVELAVTEALANVVRHAYPEGRPGDMRVTVRILPGEAVELAVSDQGKGFPPELLTAIRTPDDPMAESGRGMFILSRLMDDLELTRDAAVNTLRLRKKVGKASWK